MQSWIPLTAQKRLSSSFASLDFSGDKRFGPDLIMIWCTILCDFRRTIWSISITSRKSTRIWMYIQERTIELAEKFGIYLLEVNEYKRIPLSMRHRFLNRLKFRTMLSNPHLWSGEVRWQDRNSTVCVDPKCKAFHHRCIFACHYWIETKLPRLEARFRFYG